MSIVTMIILGLFGLFWLLSFVKEETPSKTHRIERKLDGLGTLKVIEMQREDDDCDF